MNIFQPFQDLQLTNDQQQAIEKLGHFLLESDKDVFILKGYAGSGKTTLLKGLAEFLRSEEKKFQLMAPTGRAAKVINQKTGQEATTVHKGIYSFDNLEEKEVTDQDGGISFLYTFKIRNEANVQNSVLLIDEASMVSDAYSVGEFFRFGSGHLLQDLITYSKIQNQDNATKIIFIGDPAQLPPVGMNFSPALDEKYLSDTYSLQTDATTIKEVRRHDVHNGILKSAEQLRKCMTSGFFNDFDLRENSKDIFNPRSENFLNTYFSVEGPCIVITNKNKTASDINQQIRESKFGGDLSIRESDKIIVGVNNYKYGIMNGEFGVVVNAHPDTEERVIPFKVEDGDTKRVKLTWRWVEILFSDEKGNDKTVKGYMLENYLYDDEFLTSLEQRALYIDFKNRHQDLKPRTEEFKDAIGKDTYFNAIMLKFGYAVTCHKAQGGEWESAFVFWDKGVGQHFDFYNSAHQVAGKNNKNFYRWAYTAITRASNYLYCINPPYFTSFSGMNFISTEVQQSYQELHGHDLQAEEIYLDQELQKELTQFGLDEKPITLQDHFLKMRYKARQKYIDLTNLVQKNYEIRYYFTREGDTAAIKFWVNGKGEIKPKYQKLPSETNSEQLYNEVASLFDNPLNIIINRRNDAAIIDQVEWETELEEKFPFLKELYNALVVQIEKTGIHITDIEHHQYQERYTFERHHEKAVVDFIYNGKGFFGKVLPLAKKCNSQQLVNDLRGLIEKIQPWANVIQGSQ